MLDQNDLNAIQNLLSQTLLENNKHIDERFNKVDEKIKELHHMDDLIFSEVERVHGILLKKTKELEMKIG